MANHTIFGVNYAPLFLRYIPRMYDTDADEPTPPALCLGASVPRHKPLGYEDNDPFSQLYPLCL